MSVGSAPLDLTVDELLSVEAITASVSGDPDLHCVIHLAGSLCCFWMEQRRIFVTTLTAPEVGIRPVSLVQGSSAHVIQNRGPWYDCSLAC